MIIKDFSSKQAMISGTRSELEALSRAINYLISSTKDEQENRTVELDNYNGILVIRTR